MAFEEIKEEINDIKENATSFLDTNIKYYQLWGFKVAVSGSTFIFKLLLLALFVVLTLLFLSFAVAFALGDFMGSYAYGFLIVGGFYFILCFLVYLCRDFIVEKSLFNKFSEIFFNE